MKTLKITLPVLLLFSLPAFAQKYYIKTGMGYNFSLVSQTVTSNYTANYSYSPNYTLGKYEQTYSNENNEDIKGTFGQALFYNVTGGIDINRKIALELGIGYTNGARYSGKTVVTRVLQDNGVNFQQKIYKDYAIQMLSFTPSVTLKLDTAKKIRKYIRAGIILGKAWGNAKIQNYFDDTGIAYDSTKNKTYTLNGNLAIGGTLSFGITTPLDKHKLTWFFAEAVFSYINPDLSKAELTEYTLNGSDHMAKATKSDKEMGSENIIYAESSEKKKSDIIRPGSTSFSTWGINVGLVFRLPYKLDIQWSSGKTN
jgi:hypothetical protein